MWIQVVSAWIAGSFGVLAVLGALAAYRHARDAKAAASSPDRGMRSIASAVAAHEERLSDLQTALEGLLNREKMRRVRQGAKVTGEPDPHTDPAGWKSHMRRNAALGGNQ